MYNIELHPTPCAICNTEDNATELFTANFNMRSFNPTVFSARRLPDTIHYRLVRCNNCKLVRSDPVIDLKSLTRLYAQSSFDYTDEIANLKITYGRYLSRLDNYGVKKDALLEIGCGNGFFLEEALKDGYIIVKGVEPSVLAAAKASPNVAQHIICDIMHPGLFEQEQFDVICMFQVLDHVVDPKALLTECLRILKPGGLVLCISHNIRAFSARLLKNRSPIIDIEHTYLYSPATISKIFSVCNFQVKGVGPVLNRYTLHYLARLLPQPAMLKHMILAFLKNSLIGNISLSIPLGNLYIVAQKPGISSV